MNGAVLATFDKWDVKSVEYAEAWIKHHHYYIFKYEEFAGSVYVTVKSY